MLWSFITGIPRKMYAADTRDVDFCTHATHLVKRIGLAPPTVGTTVEAIYSICNFSLVEVHMEIAIRHPRDLIHFAK